jgi:hypothetical protein
LTTLKDVQGINSNNRDALAAGKQLCHVFAGSLRLCTFEPASGGPYAMTWAPKTL